MVHLTTALEPGSAMPLYEQLYQSLAAEMRAGAIRQAPGCPASGGWRQSCPSR